MNSKIRRSRTYMERRKNLASNKPIEHTVSSKEVSIKPCALGFSFYMLDEARVNFF